jgi:hypothetical protein
MPTMKQNEGGSWEEAEPLPYLGWKAKLENRLRNVGFIKIANFLARLDERSLGK